LRKLTPSLPKVLFAASLTLSAGAFTQQPAAYSPALDEASNPGQVMAEMTRRYKLDSNQRREIKPILESRAEDLKIIAGESDLRPEKRGEKIQELRRVCNREIEAVLHEHQRMLFDRDQNMEGR
jgi:hypothetical protein